MKIAIEEYKASQCASLTCPNVSICKADLEQAKEELQAERRKSKFATEQHKARGDTRRDLLLTRLK